MLYYKLVRTDIELDLSVKVARKEPFIKLIDFLYLTDILKQEDEDIITLISFEEIIN